MTSLQNIYDQIAELQKQAKDMVQAQRQPTIDRIKEDIKTYDITAKELGFKEAKPTAKSVVRGNASKALVAPKYKLNEKTWTGRGRPPVWLVEFEANGGKRETLEIIKVS